MSNPPIVTRPTQSQTLRRLLDNLRVIDTHLDDVDGWRGADIGGQYVRIEATDILVPADGAHREYLVAVHLFTRPLRGELHDHRWPFAVYPYGVGLPGGTPLYDMPWEHAGRSGALTVRAGHPYAIEDCGVRHAVHGLCPHLSVILTDVTAPPTRPNRLSRTPLPPEATAGLLAQARTALRRTADR